MQFTDEQNRAIDYIVEWYGDPERMECYIAGYAGVGKTTVVSEAISRIKAKYDIQNVPTGAYTGKAAFVLRKKGNANAQTIHSMIYRCTQNQETGEIITSINYDGAAAMADLIVLDEVSMISQEMADDLRKFKKKILVMGDMGQLPPINGEGAFTNHTPDIFLKEIHRQAENSPIIRLATMARKGMNLPIGFDEGGVKVLPLTTTTEEHLHNPDTQVICGLNRIRWGVTKVIRDRLGFIENFPQKGERIICCKNNKKRGLFNGAMGEMKKIKTNKSGAYVMDARIEDTEYRSLIVDPYLFKQHFDGGIAKKDWKKGWDDADFSYAITCHKSQGSSFQHCTIIDDSSSFKENKWLWLYTAITRSQEGLIILVK